MPKIRLAGRSGNWVLGFAGIATLGCGVGPEEDLGVAGELLSKQVPDAIAARLPFQCRGTLTKEPSLIDSTETAPTEVYICWLNGKSETHFVDSSGHETDTDALRYAKKQSRLARHRFDDDLLEEVAKKPNETVTAHVWFDVPEEGHPPTKSDVVALSPTEVLARTSRASAALRQAADSLAKQFEAIAGKGAVVGILGGEEQITPMITVRATPQVLREIGDLDGVTAVGFAPNRDVGESTAWYYLDVVDPVANNFQGATGVGVTVADVYGGNGFPNSSMSGLAPGNCTPPSGPSFKCYCPAAAATGSGGAHMAETMGVIKSLNPALPPGVAKNATIILANDADGDVCTSNSVTGAIDWALTNGANVINRSAANSSAYSRYLDYRATISPFPMVVAAAGNSGNGSTVASNLYNGIVVGAARDKGDTNRNHLKTISTFSQSVNVSGGAAGHELPNLVAPGELIATNDGSGSAISVSGTSFSTPQVAGASATLTEAIHTKIWPEVVFSLLMVGPEQSVDGGILDLSDAVDDKDGAGALNLAVSWNATFSKLSPGATAAIGWDDDVITKAASPQGAYLNSGWTAVIEPGRTLRANAVLFTRNTCTLGNASSCTGEEFVHFRLDATSGGVVVKTSANFSSNYQYLTFANTGPNAISITLKLWIENWNSLTDTTLGFAFTQDG